MAKIESMTSKVATEQRAKAAAEQARKTEIMKRIYELEKEKTECLECISSLQTVKGQLANLESSWKSVFHNQMKSDIVREVVIPGVFEGTSAAAIKNTMDGAMEKMKNSMTGIDDVVGAISMQIGKLNQHIERLNLKIRNLRTSL